MTRNEILAEAKPILFNTEMVRAILDGRKTVTRRVIKQKAVDAVLTSPTRKENLDIADERFIVCLCDAPYQLGDILYVRETFFREECTPDCAGRLDPDECLFNSVGDSCYGYKTQYIDSTGKIKWRPSIHMPKEAARIFLRVKSVRVERLQSITPDDCVQEGVEPQSLSAVGGEFARGMFSDIWDSTIKPADRGRYGWDANPWVFVIEFERITPEGAK